MNKQSIAIYGSHDSSISVRISADEYKVYELERITGIRNYSLSNDPNPEIVLQKMHDYLKEWHGFETYDSIFWSECKPLVLSKLREIFNPAHTELMQHHWGHAACALWQSPFYKAIIISFDGGGYDANDGVSFFNIFVGDKKTNTFTRIANLPLDICSAYTMVAVPLNDIKKKDMSSYLSWAGKIMGLVAYGSVVEEWKDHFKDFYYGNINEDSLKELYSSLDYTRINSEINSVRDFQIQADIAATSQEVFQEVFFNAIRPFVEKYDLPICLTGGGALNVLLNQKIYNTYRNRGVFVPCNPNDCGLSLGFMFMRYPPDTGKLKEVMYSGFPLLINNEKTTDEWLMHTYTDSYLSKNNIQCAECDLTELARFLVEENKIIGFVQGDSEVGPRALGHRSILCYPDSIEKKDLINKKVKFREHFRPFSPVVLEEQVSHLFKDGPFDTKYMTYSQEPTKEFYDKFPAVVHEDKTARLQSISAKDNRSLHLLLSEVFLLTEYGVLMNTSFNSKGKPILTSVEEALQILKDTELDGVWIEGILFTKK